jgi:tetratricopeptide (TPR) repeat protein
VIEISSDLAAAHHGLSKAYGRMGRQAEALDEIDDAIRLDPRIAGAHLNRGITLAARRRRDETPREIDGARLLDPAECSSPQRHREESDEYWAGWPLKNIEGVTVSARNVEERRRVPGESQIV